MTKDDIALVAMHALIVNSETPDEESIVISAFEYAERFLQESRMRKEYDEIQGKD